MKNVLFLCTGNSARSIIAEAVLARAGAGRFNAFSAGSMPNGKVHPFALDLLKLQNFPTDTLRSQSWDAFAQTMRDMTRRVSLLVNLPLDRLDNLSLSARLDNIGRTEDV